MDDLISRQATIDAIFNDWDGMVVSLPTLIKCMPSAQKKGHWIATNPDEPLDLRQTCSECGNTEVLHSANFCPNCGADMRETNATKEQREQLDLMRAKAQMNIKPKPEPYKGEKE